MSEKFYRHEKTGKVYQRFYESITKQNGEWLPSVVYVSIDLTVATVFTRLKTDFELKFKEVEDGNN